MDEWILIRKNASGPDLYIAEIQDDKILTTETREKAFNFGTRGAAERTKMKINKDLPVGRKWQFARK